MRTQRYALSDPETTKMQLQGNARMYIAVGGNIQSNSNLANCHVLITEKINNYMNNYQKNMSNKRDS